MTVFDGGLEGVDLSYLVYIYIYLNLSSSLQVMMRNSSCVMSATRPFTCSACDQPCTASLMGSGGARPASLLWPDGAPAQGERVHIYPVLIKSYK